MLEALPPAARLVGPWGELRGALAKFYGTTTVDFHFESLR
jgi:hypothetical protein